MVAQRTPYFIPAHGTSLADLLRSNRVSASALATACMMANQKSWEDKGWTQDEEYAQDKLGSDGETELSELVVIWKRLRTCNSNSMFSEDFELGRHATMHLSTQIDWGQPRGIRVTQELLRNPSCLGSYRLKFTVMVVICLSRKSMDALSIRGLIWLMLSRYQRPVEYRKTFRREDEIQL